MKKRLILLMQFYDPEPIYKGQTFAEKLSELGYAVEVVTGFPNYPGGKIYDGYKVSALKREHLNGIDITRLALYPSHNSSRSGRVLNYLSFAFSAFIYLLFFARRADLVYVYHPPVTVGLAAALAHFFRRAPIVLDVHDLWPDSLPASGMIKNSIILRIINYLCNFIYRRSTHIVLHTNGIRKTLRDRGVPDEKMTTIIGWANELIYDAPTDCHLNSITGDLPGIRVVFAGNMGSAQALGSILDAAKILKDRNESHKSHFCFLGAGIDLDNLKRMTKDLELENVVFLPRVAPSAVGSYMKAADCLLVHLRDNALFAMTMPSKIQSYLLAGKPILVAMHGEAAELVQSVGAGVIAPPEDAERIASAILEIADMSEHKRELMGKAGQDYYWRELCMEKGMAKFIAVFEKVMRACSHQTQKNNYSPKDRPN